MDKSASDKEDDRKEEHRPDNVHTDTEMLETVSTFVDNSAPENLSKAN